MDPLKNTLLYPPYIQKNESVSSQTALAILLAFILMLVALAIMAVNLDPAFGIVTKSRAMYVDEGFYSDAAQNFVKFGHWGLPYDSRHWPGAPMLTVLQTGVFSVLGASPMAARLISIVFAAISLLSIYTIARTKLSPLLSLWLCIAAGLTISFTVHSRAAIADPVATGFSLLAIAVYVRLSHRSWAILISVVLGFFAFCSKMYFLFTLATLVILWLMELVVLPVIDRVKINTRQLLVFLASLGLVALSYVALRVRYELSFEQFLLINSNKTPVFDVVVLIRKLINSFYYLPFNTKTHIFIACIVLLLFGLVIAHLRLKNIRKIKSLWQHWGRSGWALSLFVVLGLTTVAALNFPQKAHYQYHAILPLACITVFGISMTLNQTRAAAVITLVLLVHVLFQAQFYYQWLSRPESTRIHDANIELVNLIEAQNENDVIPVIGQYSAQLALYSDKMVSLEVRWVPVEALCQRVDHWRPEYFVSFIFPRRGNYEQNQLLKCDLIEKVEQVNRYNLNPLWEDDLILYKVVYAD